MTRRIPHSAAVALFGLILPAFVASCPASAQNRTTEALGEASTLQNTAAIESGRPAYSPATAVKFTKNDNVFVKSALEINFTYRAAFVTLPLFVDFRQTTSRYITLLPILPTLTWPAKWASTMRPKCAMPWVMGRSV